MTDSIVDLRYLAESQPSLCIPRVFNNIDESRIRHVFDELGLGKIHHIDIIERKNEKGEPFKRAYIHFDKWFWNEDAQAVRRKLIIGKEIKIVYDNPWFWKVSANKWTPPNDRRVEGPRQISRPHIDFEDHPPRQRERDREIDDFGRSNVLRKENENRRPAQREIRNDSRDHKRPTEEKMEKKAPVHRSPSNSPPREQFIETIDYGDTKCVLKKKSSSSQEEDGSSA